MMKNISVIFLAISLFLIMGIITIRANEITVTNLGGSWAKEEGSGFSPEVFQAVKTAGHLELDLQVYPFARATMMLGRKKSACYMGGDEQAALDYIQLEVISSESFRESTIYVFTLVDHPKITNVRQLNEKRIGLPRGVKVSTLDLSSIEPTFDFAFSTENNLQKLQAGRVDVMVSHYEHLSKSMLAQLHYDPEVILYSNQEKLICHPSEKNRTYIEQFNKGLRIIKANGTLQSITEKYYGGGE